MYKNYHFYHYFPKIRKKKHFKAKKKYKKAHKKAAGQKKHKALCTSTEHWGNYPAATEKAQSEGGIAVKLCQGPFGVRPSRARFNTTGLCFCVISCGTGGQVSKPCHVRVTGGVPQHNQEHTKFPHFIKPTANRIGTQHCQFECGACGDSVGCGTLGPSRLYQQSQRTLD